MQLRVPYVRTVDNLADFFTMRLLLRSSSTTVLVPSADLAAIAHVPLWHAVQLLLLARVHSLCGEVRSGL